MAPIAKDVENSTATSIPPAAANTATKSGVEAPARPQPVPLEVPVSVNGARTIEGTDKREPFSESTKTVLVFANGAVIRLAAGVTPGQLLFVTNEKSKKEVVCQVVKSKNYRTVTGYVELEFTEPAAGFWGIRIPTEQTAPAGATKAPVATRPVTPTAAQIAVLPKAPAPVNHAAPATPVAAKPNIHPTPVAPQAAQPVAPAKPAVVTHPVAAVKPEVVHPPAPAQVHTEAKVEEKAPVVAHVPVPHVAPPQPVAAKTEVLPAQLAQQLSSLLGTEASLPHASTTQPVTPAVVHTSNDATTEELRQQAARLQEQLSSLLFRQEAAEKKNHSAAAPTVVEPASVEKPVVDAAIHVAPINHTQPAPVTPVFEAKPAVPAAPITPVPEFKPAATVTKSAPIGLQVEEVKIPSWLAPLARESETSTETGASSEASSSATAESAAVESAIANSHSVGLTEESSSGGQSVVYGGQLLGQSSGHDSQASSSGSKTGLFIGLAAATALLIGGGVWYGMQPGNFLSAKASGAPAAVSSAARASEVAPVSQSTSSANAVAPAAAVSVPTATNSRNGATSAVSAPVAETSRATSAPVPEPRSTNVVARTAAPVEQPKKPVLGDVHLATPNVNRGSANASNESAPTIDAADTTSTGDPLVGIARTHERQPTEPLPVGGDVKPARLLKTVPPIYPPVARTQRIGGNVQVDALIDVNGNVSAAKVISGPVLLHQAAVNAVKAWKYAPAQLDGKPTATHLAVTVEFKLQ
jgi:TonB family protein